MPAMTRFAAVRAIRRCFPPWAMRWCARIGPRTRCEPISASWSSRQIRPALPLKSARSRRSYPRSAYLEIHRRARSWPMLRPASATRMPRRRHNRIETAITAALPRSFRDDAVRPFHERDKDRWIAVFGAPLGEIGVSHTAGAGARATGKNLNLTGHNLLHGFLERGPANRNHGLRQRQAHQRDRLPEKEHLHRVTGFGERETVQKWKGCLGGVIRAPSALHHDLERHLRLSCYRRRTCRYH